MPFIALAVLYISQNIAGEGFGLSFGSFATGGDARLEVSCHSPYIIDGDTFSCGGKRIRLGSIDAPEMPGHCQEGRRCTEGDPFKAKDYLQSLTRKKVTCKETDIDHYGRTIAQCKAGGVNLSCAMVRAGHAVERYGRLSC